MYEITLTEFDLPSIMNSGQVFRIRPYLEEPNTYLVAAGAKAVCIRPGESSEDGRKRSFLFSCTKEAFDGFWREYFDLNTDYGAILNSIDPGDSYLQAAAKYGRGIRILKQDLWETIISFLISQNNNIIRIRRSIEALCERFGDRTEIDGALSVFSFPTPEALCCEGLPGLSGLGLGYRDKYILSMAEYCSSKEGKCWLERLKGCSYEEAVPLLLQRFGIGRKVADCICLFALHHIGAFPIDTHIRQILDAHYPNGFPFSRYEGFAGILQQYLFYYKQSGPKEKAVMESASASDSKKLSSLESPAVQRR